MSRDDVLRLRRSSGRWASALPSPGLPARGRNGSQPGGFTLIEVIVTLVILSVMAALAIPAFLRDPVVADMDDAQGRLETLFRMARDSAVRSATPVTVAFDSATGYAWLDAPASQLPGASSQAASMGSGAGEVASVSGGTFGGGSTLGRAAAGALIGASSSAQSLGLRPGVTLETFQARALFTFSPDGTVQGDSIVLRGPYGEMRHVTLDPWTGHVRSR